VSELVGCSEEAGELDGQGSRSCSVEQCEGSSVNVGEILGWKEGVMFGISSLDATEEGWRVGLSVVRVTTDNGVKLG